MNEKTKKIVTSGVLLAIASVLSFIKVYDLPYGGSITAFSMVPVMLLGYKYGIKWGLGCGVIYGVLQAVFGATMSRAFLGVNGWSVVFMTLLDFILAFAVLGLAGMFKRSVKKPALSLALGVVVSGFLRFVCHFASGYILWGGYARDFFEGTVNNAFSDYVLATFSPVVISLLYSLVYNASYMLPEIIISVIGALALMAVPAIRKEFTAN